MMSNPQNVIFVGGPGSGKSNYLFRTWIAIERQTGLLIKRGLPEDADYLHTGASMLLDGNFAPHTSKDTRHICRIPIAGQGLPDTGAMLTVPDASGELWLDLYKRREWPAAWDELIGDTCGYILFFCVGSPHNVRALDWLTCERFYSGHVTPVPTDIPTQVLLVDWLQILRSIIDRKLGYSYTPRLSVVVAAWDRVSADLQQGSPQDYLETELPLLAQFIRADAHRFDARVFGLSIFGGDLTLDQSFRQKFQESDPVTMGYVLSEVRNRVTKNSDVLLPINWALRLNV